MKNKLKILLNTSPLRNAHAVRGVGIYTKLLLQHLELREDIEVVKSTSIASKKFNPDIVHYPFFDFFTPSLPLISRKKMVITIHDTIPLIFPDQYPAGKRGTVALNYQKLALKSVNSVITDSQTSKNDIHQHLGYDLNKIFVIPLAGNPEITKTTQVEAKRVAQKYNLPKDYILYVGDINYNKNLPQLIKCLKYLPEELELVMVGKSFVKQDIPEWHWIMSQIELSDVAHRVTMINNLETDQELSAFYTGAHCYVQPSLYEGFGLPVLEAMQVQTPVVCCENSSLIEVGGGHVVFTNCTAESIADGVMQINAWSQEKLTEVVEQAQDWANSFSWAKTTSETIQVYQSLIA